MRDAGQVALYVAAKAPLRRLALLCSSVGAIGLIEQIDLHQCASRNLVHEFNFKEVPRRIAGGFPPQLLRNRLWAKEEVMRAITLRPPVGSTIDLGWTLPATVLVLVVAGAVGTLLAGLASPDLIGADGLSGATLALPVP